jgi:hypothetical protein
MQTKEGLLVELVITAYDIDNYLKEALPALRAAIYRGDLSHAKDVLSLYDDHLYGEYDLSQDLIDIDYSWIFTESAAEPDTLDPEGALVGLTYPLILAYHKPDLFRMVIGGSEMQRILPLNGASGVDETAVPIQPGYREGLRAMWEIVGYITPESTRALHEYCLTAGRERALKRSESAARLLAQIADGLKAVIEQNLGLVVERD